MVGISVCWYKRIVEISVWWYKCMVGISVCVIVDISV